MDCKILDLVWTEVEKFVDEDSKIDKVVSDMVKVQPIQYDRRKNQI